MQDKIVSKKIKEIRNELLPDMWQKMP
jgi:hypothetical protein